MGLSLNFAGSLPVCALTPASFFAASRAASACWRLQRRGYRIGFSSAGFVWHYRRSTIRAYLKQQRGYGEAEALLVRRHPENFNRFGSSIWQGRIYTSSKLGIMVSQPIIYHGVFGTGFFQTLYSGAPAQALMLCTSLEYHVLINLPLLILSVAFPYVFPVALASLLLSIGVCIAAAAQADLPKSRRQWWSRPLIALLFFLQPIVRGWARYRGRLSVGPVPRAAYKNLDFVEMKDRGESLNQVDYWSQKEINRLDFIHSVLAVLSRQGWQFKTDAGWSEYDIEILGTRWSRLQLTTASEAHANDKQLIRCRLDTSWSFLAKVAFWGAVGFELLVVGSVRNEQPWLWLILLTLPVFAWFIEQEQRDLQRLIVLVLDEVAKTRELLKIKRAQGAAQPFAAKPVSQ